MGNNLGSVEMFACPSAVFKCLQVLALGATVYGTGGPGSNPSGYGIQGASLYIAFRYHLSIV